jgi:hypothetical protein
VCVSGSVHPLLSCSRLRLGGATGKHLVHDVLRRGAFGPRPGERGKLGFSEGVVGTLNPEARALLFLVDAIGVDIFLMFLLFQGMEILRRLRPLLRFPLLRILETWSRHPLPIPNRALIRQHPEWSLYATAQAIVLALMIFLPPDGAKYCRFRMVAK